MRFLKIFVVLGILTTAYFSCKKDSEAVSFDPYFYLLNSGTSSFNNSLILFPSSDEVTYNLIISSTYLLSKEVTINIGVADNYRTSYNTANGTDYKAMPSQAYSFQTTFTASANSIYDTIPVTINKKFFSDENYMLPINIVSVSDYKFDTSSSVVYLHTESNQLAGIYTSFCKRIVYVGDATNNNIKSTDTFTLIKNVVPVQEKIAQLDYADLGINGWKYSLTYGIDGGAFGVGPNDIIQNSVQPGSFKVIATSYDSVTNDIYIKTSYKNLSGDERIVEESLTLQ